MSNDKYETVYEVYAPPSLGEYGFSGNGSMLVAVTEETDDQIIGREYSHDWLEPGGKVVFNKDNVAGWRTNPAQFEKLTRTDEEWEEWEERAGFSKEAIYVTPNKEAPHES